jgi:hypothetical protein
MTTFFFFFFFWNFMTTLGCGEPFQEESKIVQFIQYCYIISCRATSTSSHVRPTVLVRSDSVIALPDVKYPAAILASISTLESGGIRCSVIRRVVSSRASSSVAV